MNVECRADETAATVQSNTAPVYALGFGGLGAPTCGAAASQPTQAEGDLCLSPTLVSSHPKPADTWTALVLNGGMLKGK